MKNYIACICLALAACNTPAGNKQEKKIAGLADHDSGRYHDTYHGYYHYARAGGVMEVL